MLIFCVLFAYFLGLIFSPFIINQLIKFLLKSQKQVEVKKLFKRQNITSNQASIMDEAQHLCTDVAWFNLMIQRLWIELSDSYAYKNRLSRGMLKKMNEARHKKIISDLIVEDIVIAQEAPIIGNVRVINDEHYNILMEKVGKSKYTKDKIDDLVENNIFKLKNELQNYFDNCESTRDDLITLTSEFRSEIDTFSDIFLDVSTYADNSYSFDNIHMIFDMEYNGETKLYFTVNLLKKLKVNAMCTLGKFNGKVICNMPSLSSNTRWEMSFLSNPHFTINVKAFLGSAGDENIYFEGLVSTILKKIIKYSLMSKMIFPSFYKLPLPMVAPNFKFVDHKIEVFNDSKYKQWCKGVMNKILLYMAMNYRLQKKHKNCFLLKNTSLINNETDRIYLAEIRLSVNDINDVLLSRLREQKEIYIKNITHRQSFKSVENIESDTLAELNEKKAYTGDDLLKPEIKDEVDNADGKNYDLGLDTEINTFDLLRKFDMFKSENSSFKVLSKKMQITERDVFLSLDFFTLNIFCKIYKDFLYVKEIEKIADDVSVIRLHFQTASYDYIRFFNEDVIFFQSKDVKRPEFIAIKVYDGVIQLYYYLTNRSFNIDFNTIKKIKTSLFQTYTTIEKKNIVAEKFASLNLENLVATINSIKHNKQTYISKNISLNIEKSMLIGILDNANLRFKIFDSSITIETFRQVNENIKVFMVKKTKSKEEMLILSYAESGILIDTVLDKNDITVLYDFDDINTTKHIYIGCTKNIGARLCNCFTPLLIFRSRAANFSKNRSCFQSVYDRSLEYKFYTKESSMILVEVSSEISDEFYISILSNTYKVVDNLKIITLKKSTFLFSTDVDSKIKIKIKPKKLCNRQIYINIAQHAIVDFKNELVMECVIPLNGKSAKELIFDAVNNYKFVWNLDGDNSLKYLLNSSKQYLSIAEYGILPCKDHRYSLKLVNDGGICQNVEVFAGIMLCNSYK